MKLPFDLPSQSRVLLAGAGGGFDALCAVPVAVALHHAGHNVEFASYSFSNLSSVKNFASLEENERIIGITTDSTLTENDYFPELSIAKWWHTKFDESKTVWSYNRIGVRPLAKAFTKLVEEQNIDCILVVDGGVDGLFIGNEHDLATPSMDAVSIIAAHCVPNIQKIHCFTAFGTEGAEGKVRHADALLRISNLIEADGMLGVSALLRTSDCGKSFKDLISTTHRSMSADKHSVIAGSIVEAMNGSFGNCAFNVKTQTSPVWVSALTLLYWFFDLDVVAKQKPYLQDVLKSDEIMDVANAIERTRQKMKVLARADIPI